MRPWVPFAVAAAVATLLWPRRAGMTYSFGGPEIRKGVDRDPYKLLPGFARKVEYLFRALRARGYDPLLWEAYRTPERAAQLAEDGPGIKDSLHIVGGAVDIVNGAQWKAGLDPWGGSSDFWKAVGEEAERLGLTWGGRFRKVDKTHVQAVPVSMHTAFFNASRAEQERMVA